MIRTERTLWALLVGGLLLVILHLQYCSPKQPCPEPVQPAAVKEDTTLSQVKQTTPERKPQLVKEEKPQRLSAAQVPLVDSLTDVQPDSAVNDYYTLRWYRDSVPTDYGSIIINNQVSGNKLQLQQVTTDLKLPVITKTITLQQPERVELWYSLVAQGGRINPLSGVGGGLMLKLRNGQAIEADVLYGLSGNAIYQASYKRRISLRGR